MKTLCGKYRNKEKKRRNKETNAPNPQPLYQHLLNVVPPVTCTVALTTLGAGGQGHHPTCRSGDGALPRLPDSMHGAAEQPHSPFTQAGPVWEVALHEIKMVVSLVSNADGT